MAGYSYTRGVWVRKSAAAQVRRSKLRAAIWVVCWWDEVLETDCGITKLSIANKSKITTTWGESPIHQVPDYDCQTDQVTRSASRFYNFGYIFAISKFTSEYTQNLPLTLHYSRDSFPNCLPLYPLGDRITLYSSSRVALSSPWKGLKSTTRSSLTAKTVSVANQGSSLG